MPQNTTGSLIPFYINYVFPSIYDNNDCEFSKKFKNTFLLTEPINVGEYMQFNASNIYTIKVKANNIRRLDNKFIHHARITAAVNATPSIISEYNNTLLYDIEELLYYFPAEKLIN